MLVAFLPSGLLDRGQQPVAAAGAPEGPHLGGLIRAALQDAAAVAVDDLILEREPHRDGGVVAVALAPSLGEVALQQLHVGRTVDDTLGRILGELLGEIGQHLRGRLRAQAREILGAVGALHIAQHLLEGIEVVGRQADLVSARRARRPGRSVAVAAAAEPAQAGTEPGTQPAERGAVVQRRATGRCRLVAALPPRPGQPRDDHDQADLQQEAKHRGKAAKPAHQAVPEQHAKQARAEEPGEEPAHEPGATEETAAERRIRRRRTLRERAGLARLRHAALDRARARRRIGRRGRGIRLRAAAAEASATARTGVGIAHRNRQHGGNGAKRNQRAKAETAHRFLPESVYRTSYIGIRKPDFKRCCTVSHGPRGGAPGREYR